MLPILQIGPLALQTPGLALLLGLWLGLSLAERHAARHGLHPDRLYNLVFIALISGALGARLVYALRFSEAFIASPGSLISLNPGLLDLQGGLAAAGLAALIYAQRKGLALWNTLDALTPLLAVFMVFLGLSHVASGAAFGAPAHLPWGIPLWGAVRHPSQIYETLAAALILALMWPGKERLTVDRPGASFIAFVAFSAAARLFLETFRGDSALFAAGLRSAQAISWLVLAASLWAWKRLPSKLPPLPPESI